MRRRSPLHPSPPHAAKSTAVEQGPTSCSGLLPVCTQGPTRASSSGGCRQFKCGTTIRVSRPNRFHRAGSTGNGGAAGRAWASFAWDANRGREGRNEGRDGVMLAFATSAACHRTGQKRKRQRSFRGPASKNVPYPCNRPRVFEVFGQCQLDISRRRQKQL